MSHMSSLNYLQIIFSHLVGLPFILLMVPLFVQIFIFLNSKILILKYKLLCHRLASNTVPSPPWRTCSLSSDACALCSSSHHRSHTAPILLHSWAELCDPEKAPWPPLGLGALIYKIKGMQESHSWRRGRETVSTPHTACGVATREQRLKRKMGGWRMRSTEERETGGECEGEGDEKCLWKAGGYHQWF